MMLKLITAFLVSAYAAPTDSIMQWIKGEYPAELSQTMALATNAEELMAASGERNIALILPTNAAWAKHQKDYQNIQSNPSLGFNLLLDAAVEVGPFEPGSVNSIKDLDVQDYITMGGTPLIVDKNDSTKFYFAEYKSDGNLRKVGPSIKIKAKPIAKFSHVLIFEATSFAMPPSIRTDMRLLNNAEQ